MNIVDTVLEGRPIKCSHCGSSTTAHGGLPDDCTGECARVAEDELQELDFNKQPPVYSDWNEDGDEHFIHSIIDIEEWEENYEEE